MLFNPYDLEDEYMELCIRSVEEMPLDGEDEFGEFHYEKDWFYSEREIEDDMVIIFTKSYRNYPKRYDNEEAPLLKEKFYVYNGVEYKFGIFKRVDL